MLIVPLEECVVHKEMEPNRITKDLAIKAHKEGVKDA